MRKLLLLILAAVIGVPLVQIKITNNWQWPEALSPSKSGSSFGYTTELTLTHGQDTAKITLQRGAVHPAKPSSNDKLQLGSPCNVTMEHDAVVPFSLNISASNDAKQLPGVELGYVASAKNRRVNRAQFSVLSLDNQAGTTKTPGQDDARCAEMNPRLRLAAPRSTMVHLGTSISGFVILSDFYTADHPSGDLALIKGDVLTLKPVFVTPHAYTIKKSKGVIGRPDSTTHVRLAVLPGMKRT